MDPNQDPQHQTPSADGQAPQTPAQDTPPADATHTPQPQVVYVTRPMNPVEPHITEEVKARHAESVRRYPNLNLSEGEYVISAVKRHPIGLFPIFGFVGFMLIFLTISLPFYEMFRNDSAMRDQLPSVGILALLALLVGGLFVIGGLIAAYVYTQNKFFLTNESVIQEIQTSLFSRHEQTVSLSNIEDASFRQEGIMQKLFNYGSIRLSTEGDETTYRFSYVANPKKEIAILNNAVEAFKNGRPVD